MRRAVLLNGARQGEAHFDQLQDLIVGELAAAGWTVLPFTLRSIPITACAGCFACWVKTPGECVMRDDNKAITAATIAAELTILLTPIVFGGYSSELKKVVDHQIPLVKPFFRRISGETHHETRYDRYPDLLAIGVQPTADEAAAQIFGGLVERHALNFHARRSASVIWPADAPVATLKATLGRALAPFQGVAA
jgi:multimeric flavodoxin WrbA